MTPRCEIMLGYTDAEWSYAIELSLNMLFSVFWVRFVLLPLLLSAKDAAAYKKAHDEAMDARDAALTALVRARVECEAHGSLLIDLGAS